MSDKRQDEFTYYEKDTAFIINIENSLQDARRLLNAVVRDWNKVDRLTIRELLSRAHTTITNDLYFRIEAVAERRGMQQEFKYDVGLLIDSYGELNPKQKGYHSKLINLYFRLMSRYIHWMDVLGILLTPMAFNPNFAEEILELMAEERRAKHEAERAMMVEQMLHERRAKKVNVIEAEPVVGGASHA